MDAATKFVGRAISRRLKRAIDERYPDLRACLSDGLVFLAGGRRTVPMPSDLSGITMAHADAIVAQLRNG